MPLSRRKTLALIVGGMVLAVAAPTTGFLLTRTPHKALEPWNLAGSYTDVRMNAMSYALLAPNPHNRQPWLAELIGKDRLVIYRDVERDLPVTDPYARQLTIGMGCFLELMDMAAAGMGFDVVTTLFPKGEGEDGPVAECRFVPATPKRDPLFAHVQSRRSHKEAFEEKLVTDAVAEPLRNYAQIFHRGEQVDMLRRIAHDAWMAEAATPAAWQESVDLLRIGKNEINAHPDGIDVGGPTMDGLALLGLLTREAASDLNDPGTRSIIESNAEVILSAPAYAMVTTATNSRMDQIAAGRRWLRLNLATTGMGLALRPVSQCLQEYDEVKPYYDDVHTHFAPNDARVQMLGLLGYGALTPQSPRWPIDTRIMNV